MDWKVAYEDAGFGSELSFNDFMKLSVSKRYNRLSKQTEAKEKIQSEKDKKAVVDNAKKEIEKIVKYFEKTIEIYANVNDSIKKVNLVGYNNVTEELIVAIGDTKTKTAKVSVEEVITDMKDLESKSETVGTTNNKSKSKPKSKSKK